MKINLVNFFEDTAKKMESKVAVVDKGEQYTFSDIRREALNVCGEIKRQLGQIKNQPIAVFLPKSKNTVISNLGISYSCNAFMNLDIKTPTDRIKAIIEHIEPVMILVDHSSEKAMAKALQEVSCPPPVCLVDEMLQNDLAADVELFSSDLDMQIDTDPSCIINTSGSTGVPKGVILNHKSFIDFLDWAEETFSLGQDAIMGSLSPSVFDIYVFELWLMCKKGAAIVLLDSNLAMFPAKLLQQMKENRVNFIFWVPSIMVTIANMDLLSKIELDTLKLVWFAGEVFPTKQFNYWKRHLPNTKFANLYGPIEITLDCTYYIVDRDFDDSEPLPIGFPCRNTDVLILNEENELCKTGEEGELCVRGTSLAMGYYKDPEKTAAAFTQNPLNPSYPELIYRTGDMVLRNENGEIIFKGRKDSLIKHMGYRIELGEIEHVILNKLKLVKYCCVVYKKATKEITLIYEHDEDIEPAVFRKSLMQEFPKYMLPNVYIRKNELPRNTNGKIDRQQLNEEVNGKH